MGREVESGRVGREVGGEKAGMCRRVARSHAMPSAATRAAAAVKSPAYRRAVRATAATVPPGHARDNVIGCYARQKKGRQEVAGAIRPACLWRPGVRA